MAMDTYTVRDIATLLDVSIRTVWRMVEDRRLPLPLHPSRSPRRWPVFQIHNWLEQKGMKS